ncbi:MAG: response regulator transcription factor [Acidobacteria bacterium]|nr:response regulator transcription factor [Acidobacteriota bacterium]
MAGRILIVEDDKDIAELLRFHLSRAGFTTEICTRAGQALESIRRKPPALVVLDLTLPDMDGIEICKRLKFQEATREVSILILTARNTELDRILGLELGADDYLPKPFSPRELVLRVQAILRRTDLRGHSQAPPLVLGPLKVDVDAHRVTLHEQPVNLTAIEFKLLEYLIDRRGKVARREDLLNSVWGYQYTGGTRTVDTHIQRLRGKLGNAGEWIETIRSIGYRFREAGADGE